MANELQEKLDAILADKNTNLKPENLKKGITLLGIEGEVTFDSFEDYDICDNLVSEILNTNHIELEYIESTGTQWTYLDFNIYGNSKSYRTEIIMQLRDFNNNEFAVMGTGNYYMGWRAGTYNKVAFAPDTTFKATSIGVDTDVKHTFYMDAITKKYGYDTSSWSFTPASSDNRSSVFGLFCYATGYMEETQDYNYASVFSARLYGCKIWNNGILLYDCIPVIRKIDNTVCLFDKVSNTYILNRGIGEFIAGPNKM